MRNLLNSIISFCKDILGDGSFFVFLMAMALVLVVGVMDSGYNNKYNKLKLDYNERTRENIFQKSIIDTQRQTIDRQKQLIDELLKQLKEEKKGKIYA